MSVQDTSDEALLAVVRELVPAFCSKQTIRSRTSFVLCGSVDGTAAVAKVRLPDWRQHCLREIEVYRHFAERPAPVRTPALIAADPGRGVLVVEQVPASPLDGERHPTTPLAEDDLTDLLAALRRIATWSPPEGTGWSVDYRPLIALAQERQMLDDHDRAAMERLVERAGPGREFGHGDPALANVLRADGELWFIDWACADVFLPGFDLAQLWVLLGRVTGGREAIDRVIAAGGTELALGFVVNLTLLMAREIRGVSRRVDRYPDDADARERLVSLRGAWSGVLERMRQDAA
ncbi:phosphotransferase [Micromonospora sp. NPDC005215]|uniref:phosphotransferase n=1 Tax=Micromonospora sp. NPDC005215 TaxID=3157024 RepID=UPI0033B8785E